ncbi:MAG: aminopeptidase P family protein [Candidatus Eremiobacteraeota bacterium]|nr:aminopeptidase P family protein [Candidatus Eremiobacteraeota bacterium]
MPVTATHFSDRRLALADLQPGIPALFFSGTPQSRNFSANLYPFRASSHYLYFGAPPIPDAFLLVLNGEATLFVDLPDAREAVWTGEPYQAEQLLNDYGFEAVRPLAELESTLDELQREEVVSLPLPSLASNAAIEKVLGRTPDLEGDFDSDLAQAMVELRLCHDSAAIDALRRAAAATVEAHRAVYGQVRSGVGESEVLSRMMACVIGAGRGVSFEPIVSVHGEVLHNPFYNHKLAAGDLLVVDFGAELANGWAGDVTRTYPVDGNFTPEQKAAYELVLAAQARAIEKVAPGVHYRDVHLAACQVMAEGLVELGLLKGNPTDLVERGAHALFFPHGIGHLLGLDVHDMEDLGDLAGYEYGQTRSQQFGLCYLRLARPLQPGMLVTIEPGFYWIPQLLESSERLEPFKDCLDLERVAQFRGVRGIRIEDELLVTEDGHENLTAELAKSADEVAAKA